MLLAPVAGLTPSRAEEERDSAVVGIFLALDSWVRIIGPCKLGSLQVNGVATMEHVPTQLLRLPCRESFDHSEIVSSPILFDLVPGLHCRSSCPT